MPYQTKPRFLKDESFMHQLLSMCSGKKSIVIDDFDIQFRRDIVYPAKRLGLVKQNKSRKLDITSTGKKLLATVK
jgi:hypothetical protein